MKLPTIIAICLISVSGCNKSDVTSPAIETTVSLNFTSGFQGDSLIILNDGSVLDECRGFSDSLNMVSGYQFIATEGMHLLSMNMPILHTQNSTTFWTYQSLLLVIDAYLDRKTMTISYKLHYQKFNQNSASQPPNQSLKLTEPAVDDFARAKQPATVGHDLPRVDWIPSLRHFVAAA